MSDLNQEHNRVVWIDIPVADVARACKFYTAVLAVEVSMDSFDGTEFGVLEHGQGNGGCLFKQEESIASDKGLLVYFNAEGRIRDAVKKAEENGGKILQDTHQIGPHGFRAMILDSEGNRVALHSMEDA